MKEKCNSAKMPYCIFIVMKSKLRKIVVDNNVYYYRFSYKYYHSGEKCKSIIRVFREDNKNTPLIIEFDTLADAITGNPLNCGIEIDKEEASINLNLPKNVRQIIIYGIEKGWTGDSIMAINGGYDLINDVRGQT